MKKILVFIIGMILFVGCDNRTDKEIYEDYLKQQKQEQIKQVQEERWHGFDVIVIDSCEYLIKKEQEAPHKFRGFGWGLMAHKGNCKYCKERNDK